MNNILLDTSGTDSASSCNVNEPSCNDSASSCNVIEPSDNDHATSCCCSDMSDRKKKRSPEEQRALLTRLRKAEGQIRGIQKMVENDAYCPDILIQVSAVTSALNSFNKELLACHMRSCVSEDIRAGKDEAIDEFVKVMQKLMR